MFFLYGIIDREKRKEGNTELRNVYTYMCKRSKIPESKTNEVIITNY